MRFTTYWPTEKELQRQETWKPWFAWYPVSYMEGRIEVTVWLEKVLRKPYYWRHFASHPYDVRYYKYKTFHET